jgi:predicted DNA-binding protein (MmcQ/YjbR family)
MAAEWFRRHCMSQPRATENVQWGYDLVFKVGGKMFAVLVLEPATHVASFKCIPEEFAELIERPGIDPAPYLARAHWVALQSFDALPREEVKRLVHQSYELVLATLPKKTQRELTTNRKPGRG